MLQPDDTEAVALYPEQQKIWGQNLEQQLLWAKKKLNSERLGLYLPKLHQQSHGLLSHQASADLSVTSLLCTSLRLSGNETQWIEWSTAQREREDRDLFWCCGRKQEHGLWANTGVKQCLMLFCMFFLEERALPRDFLELARSRLHMHGSCSLPGQVRCTGPTWRSVYTFRYFSLISEHSKKLRGLSLPLVK